MFGHRVLFSVDAIKNELKKQLKSLIEFGVVRFLIGYNGEFDKLALETLCELRTIYEKIEIVIVVSNINNIKKNKFGYSKIDDYEKFETMVYDIEEVHFKRIITKTNQCMVDDSDFVVCYSDLKRGYSGSKLAVKYAIKKNKKVINIFDKIGY